MNEMQNSEDLRLELRFKNARLWHAIYDQWGSVASFCAKFDVEKRQAAVGQLINLKSNPLRKDTNEPSFIAKWLCDTLGYSFNELFPLYLYESQIPSIRVTEVFGEQVLSLDDPVVSGLLVSDSEKDEKLLDLRVDLERMLKTLTSREEIVISKRFFEGMTLKEIGDELNVTQERVRQIEIKAMRKLRHPSRGIKDIIESWRTGSSPLTKVRRLSKLKTEDGVQHLAVDEAEDEAEEVIVAKEPDFRRCVAHIMIESNKYRYRQIIGRGEIVDLETSIGKGLKLRDCIEGKEDCFEAVD